MLGTVDKTGQRGYFFIVGADGRRYFAHTRRCVLCDVAFAPDSSGRGQLRPGTRVRFDVVRDDDGHEQAYGVRVVPNEATVDPGPEAPGVLGSVREVTPVEGRGYFATLTADGVVAEREDHTYLVQSGDVVAGGPLRVGMRVRFVAFAKARGRRARRVEVIASEAAAR